MSYPQKPASPALNSTLHTPLGMTFALPFTEGAGKPKDLVSGAAVSTNFGQTWGTGAWGPEGVFSAAEFDTGKLTGDMITTTAGTIIAHFTPTGTAPTKTVAYTGEQIFGNSGSWLGIFRAIIGTDDKIWIYNFDSSEKIIGVDYVSGEPICIAWVHGGGKLKIYKNGVLSGSIASAATGGGMPAAVAIGARSYQGSISSIQTFPYALTDSQIAILCGTSDDAWAHYFSTGEHRLIKPASPVLSTANSLETNLISEFPMIAGSGSTLTDLFASHNISLSGSPTWGTGLVGPKLTFNGSTQYGATSEVAAYSTLQNSDFGIRMFFTPTYVGARNSLLMNYDIHGRGIIVDILATDSVRVVCGYGGDGTISRHCDSTTTLTYTELVELWAIQRSGVLEIWMNGVNVSGSTLEEGVIVNATSTDPLRIAYPSFAGSTYYSGSMSSLEIFNRAPTTSEISALHLDSWAVIQGIVDSGGAGGLSRLLLARRRGIL